MAARCKVSPVYVVDCDGCGATFEPEKEWGRAHERAARSEAQKAGWTVRPNFGKGSRTAPDLCPAHTEGGTR